MSEDNKSLPASTSKAYETATCMSTTKSPAQHFVTDNLKKSQHGPVQKYQRVLYSIFFSISISKTHSRLLLLLKKIFCLLPFLPCFQYYPKQ